MFPQRERRKARLAKISRGDSGRGGPGGTTVKETIGEFTREIVWRAAYDKRDPEPAKNYGIHGLDMTWYLHGSNGTIQFVVFTGWHLKHVKAELDARLPSREFPHLLCGPTAADIGYHAPVPQYEDHEPMGPCEHLGGKPCYYDGSSLPAEPILEALIASGEDAVWLAMQEWYDGLILEAPQ